MKEQRLFTTLQLSETDFDIRGDAEYLSNNSSRESIRGGFPYYPPVGWLRYGLNVSRYEEDGWLANDGNPN